MSVDIEEQASKVAELAIAQLFAISMDSRNSEEIQTRADDLMLKFSKASLQKAVANFERRNQEFADLTQEFVALTTIARRSPGGDTVGTLTPLLRSFGELQSSLIGEAPEPVVSADSFNVEPESPHAPAHAAIAAPAPGRASASRKLSEIGPEYLAMFDAAAIDADKVAVSKKLARMLVSYRTTYEQLQRSLGIPWYFTGLVHCMESGFNFGTHLHNGDSLMHRTVRVPAGRPPAEIADPPFSWVTSAIDALTLMGLQTQSDWSLAPLLYRLERYNGFGYRMRGIASPYLWSFSDRYTQGKFVSDGKFDPEAVSRQCGAAVILKLMIEQNVIPRP